MKYIVEFEDEPCMCEDEVHFYKCIQAPWLGLSEKVIEQLTPYQPDVPDTNVGNKISKFIDGIEEIFADIRERHGDDSVCGLCEYDGAYMGQSGDWCNECPGFDKDDCFKLSDETRKKWIEEIVNAYSDHTADSDKKVSISCGQENDLISRQEALKELAAYIHLIDKTMGKGTLTDDDCMEAAKSVLGEDELPAVQPDHVADIGKKVSISCAHENDVISREAAIEALARMMPRSYTPDGSHPADEEIFRAQEVFADCIEALEILPSAQPEPHWIPCSERLPEESGKYLVTVLDGIGKRTTSAPYHLRSKSWTLTGRMTYWKVIAWMPLPEPYKGGGTE